MAEPAAGDLPWDVFVSYRSAPPDGPWVRTVLVPGLRAAGLRVCLDVDTFRLGRPVVTEVNRAVEGSRWTVAVLSPAYLDGAWTDLESVLAEHLETERRRPGLLLVVREPCRPRLSVRARLMLDLTQDDAVGPGLARLVDTVASGDGGDGAP